MILSFWPTSKAKFDLFLEDCQLSSVYIIFNEGFLDRNEHFKPYFFRNILFLKCWTLLNHTSHNTSEKRVTALWRDTHAGMRSVCGRSTQKMEKKRTCGWGHWHSPTPSLPALPHLDWTIRSASATARIIFLPVSKPWLTQFRNAIHIKFVPRVNHNL